LSSDASKLIKGTRLGDYEIQSLLGAGGMGEVYRARDLRLRRDVAIKILPASFASDLSVPQGSIIGNLSWFPDGTRIVATLADSTSNVDSIWVLSVLSTSHRKLREGGSGAAVSPDGSQIAFSIVGREIWLMGANGEAPHRILAAGEGDQLPGLDLGWKACWICKVPFNGRQR
jgi:hypothetical protein